MDRSEANNTALLDVPEFVETNPRRLFVHFSTSDSGVCVTQVDAPPCKTPFLQIEQQNVFFTPTAMANIYHGHTGVRKIKCEVKKCRGDEERCGQGTKNKFSECSLHPSA